MAKGRKGFGGQVLSLLMLFVVAGFMLAFFKVNNISNTEELLTYLRTLGQKADACSDSVAAGGKCDVKLPTGGPQSPGSNPGGVGKPTPTALPPGDWGVAPPTDPSGVNQKAPGGKATSGGGASTAPLAVYQAALDKVKVENEKKVAYKRSEWRHWVGVPCDARKQALITQGRDVKATRTSSCKILSGTWVDPYAKNSNGSGGDTFTDPSKLDVDHSAALSYVAHHGGQAWPAAKKQAYANDQAILIVASAQENRSKGDKGPAAYMPQKAASHCMYAKAWVTGATKYGFTITPQDRDVLKKALGTCKA